ncbi:hypothetical protein [Streptomyces sp. NBC_00986]|uniref:hypothetical protein n=1 Tax=Streptomyces sp. NBC_00986 TaxID=2903702 RepID=UPI00386FE4DE|nr:hypothetical protein OG504_45225 [Streptomyces sp. NBC_00986]
MTHPVPLPATPREAIAAALDAYWITTPPGEDIYWTVAAEQIDDYLTGCGWTITTTAAAAVPHCTCPPPSRANVAVTALLALACLTACLGAWIRGEETWAFIALIGATALANEAADNLRLRTRQASR